MNGLRIHIKNSKECFIRYPSTSNSVKKIRLRLVSSTHFSVLGYPDETLFLVFDILLKTLPQSQPEARTHDMLLLFLLVRAAEATKVTCNSLNPLNPNSDENEISLYIVTTCSNIQVRRIREVVTKDKLS